MEQLFNVSMGTLAATIFVVFAYAVVGSPAFPAIDQTPSTTQIFFWFGYAAPMYGAWIAWACQDDK